MSIYFLLYNLKSSFSTYFGINPSYIDNGTLKTQLVADNFGYHIINNVFENINNNAGYFNYVLTHGAIHFRSILNVFLLVELCSFHQCDASGIYFNCPLNGSFICIKTCAYKCSTFNIDWERGQFSYSVTNLNNIHKMISISISKCNDYMSSSTYDPISMEGGDQEIKNCNFSENRVYQVSALRLYKPNNISLSYSSFSDNSPTHSICIDFYAENRVIGRAISFCNIIRNISPSGNGIINLLRTGTDHYYHHIVFSDCIFFQNHNTLFCMHSSAYYIIYRGWIQHLGSFHNVAGWLFTTFVSNTGTVTETYLLTHFRTHYCNKEFQGMELSPCQTLYPLQTQCYSEVSGIRNDLFFLLSFLKYHLVYLINIL